jgi:hypothetical protein
MTTSPFAAVGGTRGKAGVAFAADLLVAFVLGGKYLHGGFDDSTTKTEDQVKSGLLLDVVVTQSSSILQLLSSEDETLLVGGDASRFVNLGYKYVSTGSPFLILDFGLDVVDRIRGLYLEGDRLAREGLDENLHVFDGKGGGCVSAEFQFLTTIQSPASFRDK